MENNIEEIKFTVTYDDLLSQLNENKVKIYSQDIHDLPPEILFKNKKAKLSIEFEPKNEIISWYVRYKDEETNDVVLECSAKASDYAISRMIDKLCNRDTTDLEGNKFFPVKIGSLHRKQEYALIDKSNKLRVYKSLLHISCPYCDSNNVESTHYRSSQDSWLVLAGREGYKHICKDCGYYWDECTRMS